MPACRAQYEQYPDSTLHVSSEWYLDDLRHAGELPVFTVDYALDPANIAWVLAESRARGFVPFVGTRWLDVYQPPR